MLKRLGSGCYRGDHHRPVIQVDCNRNKRRHFCRSPGSKAVNAKTWRWLHHHREFRAPMPDAAGAEHPCLAPTSRDGTSEEPWSFRFHERKSQRPPARKDAG
ncbi:hypothetical protein ABID19_000521 [Mesorhizobium robiniae]|uniref:Transposase n=1 Tax=Mesorhizobium robiniae TaxID=559315 RepID=A0ABV2GGU2_9HYPH